MGSHTNIVVWQRAMDLVDEVYVAVEGFPRSELYGLSQQMRAAAVSMPSLIAEGRGRYTVADQRHFYYQARGSAQELQTQIEIAMRRKFVTAEQGMRLKTLADEVGRRINALINSLRPKA